jgi:hypothetical protein
VIKSTFPRYAGLGASVTHDQQREAVSGHVEGTIGQLVLFVYFNGSDEPGGLSRFGHTLQNGVDVSKDMSMILPKELSHVPAVGKHFAVLDVDDRDASRIQKLTH